MIKAYGCIDIVIRRDSLERKEKGLSEKFIKKYKVKPPHYDKDIICIPGGMNPYDVETTIMELEQNYGLVFNSNVKETAVTDFVIVEPWSIYPKNSWLKEKQTENGYTGEFYFV